MRPSVSALWDDFSFEHMSAVTANWKRDQASTTVDDALTHTRRYGPPLAVTIRFRTVVLLFSQNCRVIEGKRAAARGGFADNGDTIANEFETRWFSHFPAHSGARAVVNQTGIATSFLAAKIAEIMLSIYEVTRIAKYDVMIEGSTADTVNWQLLLLIVYCRAFFIRSSGITEIFFFFTFSQVCPQWFVRW